MRHDAQVDTPRDNEPTGDWVGITFEEMVAMSAATAGSPDHPRAASPAWARLGHQRGGAEYVRLVEALRQARDAVAEARLTEAECIDLSARVEEFTAHARSLRGEVGDRVWAQRFDLAARGSTFPPPLRDIRVDLAHGRVRAQVTFGTSYVGAGQAAHGGAVALLFDEVLGLCSNAGRAVARTAYLHVDYRAVTPLNVPLTVSARVDRLEGRKRFVVGELREGEQVVAEAEGLFIELRSWQD